MHINNILGAPEVPLPKPYTVIGNPGTSMQTDQFKNTFSQQNTQAGSIGENILFHKLRNPKNGWVPADIPLFCSLSVPGKRADIDFAICKGNRILLIDAKMYRQDGGIYWNFGENSASMNRNFSSYRNRKGDPVKLSKSAVMARDILSRNLKGYIVESIVVFVTDPNNPSAKIPNTTFLTFPGKVQVFNDRTAQKFIQKFFKGQRRTVDTANAEKYLASITQR